MLTVETGSGEDIFAQGIYNESELFTKPFITLNCSTLAEDNIFTQLYGSENEETSGKFTGGKRWYFACHSLKYKKEGVSLGGTFFSFWLHLSR